MRGIELSKYQICLLMWYFGIDGDEVRHSEWEEATLAKAERYAKSQDVDVEEWEKVNYAPFTEFFKDYISDMDIWNMSDSDYNWLRKKAMAIYKKER